jgi:hypothetical protein
MKPVAAEGPLTNYKIEIFCNLNADASGIGEGET